MANYDFATLNDRDLEELVRDLLSSQLDLNLQSFRPGADKGIDLRYSVPDDDNSIVVQVKHYLNSGLSKLKQELRNSEKSKVSTISPTRYIVCTSLPLLPQDKEEIRDIFSPYIQSVSDVIGKEDLNKWLEDYPDVQQRHFKLWLSSIELIKRILKNGINGRSEFYREKILREITLYVPNRTHSQAVEALNTNHFILITGAPGIGKSTLANMLTFQLLAEDFELVYVREITEAEEAFIPEKKQAFYFDDFLGAITLDLYSSRNADSAIVNFIERIRSDKYKRLILTCRTTILNQAKSISDKIQNSNIDASNYEVRIEDYSDWDKARILYNHIYLSNLQEHQKNIYFQNDFHWKVISHKYYNPRLIQSITNINNLVDTDYTEKFILSVLNDPKKIWEKPFNVQIMDISRLLLITLYSLGGKYVVTDEKLKEAFNSRLNYEVATNNLKRVGNEYNTAIKELIGGFINRTIEKDSVRYSFFNPSVEDFIFDYFRNSPDEYLHLFKSALYFEQFKYRITVIPLEREKRLDFSKASLNEKLYTIFSEKKTSLKGYTYGDSRLNTISTLIRLFPLAKIRKEIITETNLLDCSYLNWEDRDNLIEILKYLSKHDLAQYIINLSDLFISLSKDIVSYYQIKSFALLVKENPGYQKLITDSKLEDTGLHAEIQSNIDLSWEKHSDDFIINAYNINDASNKDELEHIINDRKEEAIQINKDIGLEGSSAILEYEFDTYSHLELNKTKDEDNDLNIKAYQERNNNEVLSINRLFNSNSTEGNPYDLPF